VYIPIHGDDVPRIHHCNQIEQWRPKVQPWYDPDQWLGLLYGFGLEGQLVCRFRNATWIAPRWLSKSPVHNHTGAWLEALNGGFDEVNAMQRMPTQIYRSIGDSAFEHVKLLNWIMASAPEQWQSVTLIISDGFRLGSELLRRRKTRPRGVSGLPLPVWLYYETAITGRDRTHMGVKGSEISPWPWCWLSRPWVSPVMSNPLIWQFSRLFEHLWFAVPVIAANPVYYQYYCKEK